MGVDIIQIIPQWESSNPYRILIGIGCGGGFDFGIMLTWKYGNTNNEIVSLCHNLGMAKDTTMHVVLPTDLKKEFKAACVFEGVNMSQVVCELIHEWLEQRNAKLDEANKSSDIV